MRQSSTSRRANPPAPSFRRSPSCGFAPDAEVQGGAHGRGEISHRITACGLVQIFDNSWAEETWTCRLCCVPVSQRRVLGPSFFAPCVFASSAVSTLAEVDKGVLIRYN